MPIWLVIFGQLIQLFFMLFRYGPEIVLIVKEIMDLIKKLPGTEEKNAAAFQLQTEVSHFRKTRDWRPLHRLRERLQVQCFGEC